MTLDFVLVEEGNLVCDHPWYAASEVYDLVHHERHNARGEHVVLHVRIPCCPGLFEDVEVHIVVGDFLEVVRVGCR